MAVGIPENDISFFGIGLINLAFALTVRALEVPSSAATVPSWLLILGAVTVFQAAEFRHHPGG